MDNLKDLVSKIQDKVTRYAYLPSDKPRVDGCDEWRIEFDTYCREFPEFEYVRKMRPAKDEGFWNASYTPYYYFLHHLVKDLKLNKVLELGTAEGVSALFMASAGENVRILTVDHSPCVLANIIFPKTGRIGFIQSDSFGCYETVLKSVPEIDLIFIDTFHEGHYTIKEFRLFKDLVKVGGFFVFDDLNLIRDGWNILSMEETNWEFLELDSKLHWTGFGLARRIK